MKGKILLALLFVLLAAGVVSAAEAATTGTEAAGAAPENMKYLAACLAVGLSGFAAAYAIAKVGTAAAGAIVENPKLFGNTILYVAFAEAIAIYGLLVALMIIGA